MPSTKTPAWLLHSCDSLSYIELLSTQTCVVSTVFAFTLRVPHHCVSRAKTHSVFGNARLDFTHTERRRYTP